MRILTLFDREWRVMFCYQPGRFPQRRNTFIAESVACDEDGTASYRLSASGCTPRFAWRNLMVEMKRACNGMHLTDALIRHSIVNYVRSLGYHVEPDTLRIYGYGEQERQELSGFQGHIVGFPK